MYTLRPTKRFDKELKRAKRRGKDIKKLQHITKLLLSGQKLPLKNRDHALTGNFVGRRECHIEPNWLLIYKIDEEAKEIIFERTGSHSDLF